jgi:GntR family transcriptional regulator
MYDPDASVDHEAPVPPYRQLAGILAARITRGDWQPNRAIPSEAQLVREYGLARATVRRAIAVLVNDNILFVVPQRGTYVTDQSPD